MIEKLGATVILEVQRPLTGLMATLKGSPIVIAKGDILPPFELHCPLMSLPLAFGTSLETIPADCPYLCANEQNRQMWKDRLGPRSRPRIGLAWSGAPGHRNDKNRSISLEGIAPLLMHDFEYHSLQKDVRPTDAPFLSKSSIISHGDNLNDFVDTASLISEMDIVISVDTAVAHLAGALNKPVWLLLPFVPDFRWLTDRPDSPWYPSARLFRQQRPVKWDSVIARVAAELAQFTAAY
jgi:hypothetical protein